eukprot:CAMPEP_0113304820 /NCGR_PEP_ID=MMETSP0010_2-20120614/4677_1 /TAXON_ID=216773 ORGANISM="Corethron hystrix, Strain 308" /NCGR_SAMPLE_ID=MMETSP0010_2 /ASSEMBLY_ACC=CAM_ASM_000155 /LENGTH=219 /DNA_ID=CAMNT_0000159081 /DNA_START=96 /DNA_END=755 /DNA_ORIENTATION=- /assembly_acc=CAM_ASM_000155
MPPKYQRRHGSPKIDGMKKYSTSGGTDDGKLPDDDRHDDDDNYGASLSRRIQRVRLDLLERQLCRPPNPSLSATDTVREILDGLRDPDAVFPDGGFRSLLRCSTPKFKSHVYVALGAPVGSEEERVVAALRKAMSRPRNNQWGILIGGDVGDRSSSGRRGQEVAVARGAAAAVGKQEEEYYVQFTHEPVDYLEEGSCWLDGVWWTTNFSSSLGGRFAKE